MTHSVSFVATAVSSQAQCSCGFKGFVRTSGAAAVADARKHQQKVK